MGLTETGYTRLTFDDILNNKIAKAQQLFGEDIDTSELTPLGKFIRINAYDQALAEEEAEGIYYARFPNTASGTSLDRLCAFVGITRNPATAAQFIVTVTGVAGATVEMGFLVGVIDGQTFYNIQDTEIEPNGTCTIYVECTEAGTQGNVDYADINQIVNPSANVTAVNGTIQAVVGTDIESDYSLRNRFAEAREGLGSCNENAIRAALLRVPTVTSAGVIVNETDSTDAGNRPARSFECYVNGGTNYHKEIAETIFDKKPLGIKTYGTETYTITDDGGHSHIIKFSHTSNVIVKARIKIKTTAAYGGDTGADNIKNNVSTYINGLGVGSDVIISSLYGQIHAVAGVTEVTELKLSTDGGISYTTTNVTVADYQIAQCGTGDVSVTVVT